MAARKLTTAISSTVLSIATSASVIASVAKTERVTSMHHLQYEKHDIEEHFIFAKNHDCDQLIESAEMILDETRDEIDGCVKRFITMNFLENAKVGALVSTRFVDLLTRAAVVLLDYKLHGLLDASNEDLSEVHQRAAQSLLEACTRHGGLLVKFGQYLSNHAGTVVPKEYVEALKPLQDSCTPLPFELIRELVEQELCQVIGNRPQVEGKLFDEVFEDFDPVPLGVASLAQVHGATLKDGRRVAVKIQRKHLSMTTKADILVLQVLARAVDRAFPGSGFEWLLPEFQQTITAELDFTQEAVNASRCSWMLDGVDLSPSVSLLNLVGWRASQPPRAIIPTPINELTTQKMLTMSFEEGIKVTNVNKLSEHGIDPKRVAGALCTMFAELMLVHGFVYLDCHPGNVLVRPRKLNGKSNGEFDIVLLDHGMYRRLDERNRSGLCTLWAGLIYGNDNEALKGVRALGLDDKHLDILGLVMVYRIPQNIFETWTQLMQRDVVLLPKIEFKTLFMEFIKSKAGGDLSPTSINEFFKNQSRDFLYCSRCTSLVRGLNLQLGGTTLSRFVAFGSAAMRGASLNSGDQVIVPPQTETQPGDMDMLDKVKAELNRPVVSEILASQHGDGMTTASRSTQQQTLAYSVGICGMIIRTWWKDFLINTVHLQRRPPVVYRRQLG